MIVDGKQMRPIWLDENEQVVKIIDQRHLPHELLIVDLTTVDDVIAAIREMYVRGAPLIVGECFGLKAMGTIFGVLAIAAVLGGAIGPLLAGFIFDTMGTYYPAFVIFSVGEVTAAIAIFCARRDISGNIPIGRGFDFYDLRPEIGQL